MCICVYMYIYTTLLSGLGLPTGGTVVPRAEDCSSNGYQWVSTCQLVLIIRLHLILAARKAYNPSLNWYLCLSVLSVSCAPAWSCDMLLVPCTLHPATSILYLVSCSAPLDPSPRPDPANSLHFCTQHLFIRFVVRLLFWVCCIVTVISLFSIVYGFLMLEGFFL